MIILPEDSHLMNLFFDDYSTRRQPFINLFWDVIILTEDSHLINLLWDVIIVPEDSHLINLFL